MTTGKNKTKKAGVRKKSKKVIHVGFTAPLPLVAKFQKQAKQAGVSRATWIRNKLQAGL